MADGACIPAALLFVRVAVCEQRGHLREGQFIPDQIRVTVYKAERQTQAWVLASPRSAGVYVPSPCSWVDDKLFTSRAPEPGVGGGPQRRGAGPFTVDDRDLEGWGWGSQLGWAHGSSAPGAFRS